MVPYLNNAIFKVYNILESLPSFWIMRSQRSRRRDKGLYICYCVREAFISGTASVQQAAKTMDDSPMVISDQQRPLSLSTHNK